MLGARSEKRTTWVSSASIFSTPVTLAMNRPVRFWAIDFSQPQTTSAAVISLPKMLRTPLRSVKT